MVVVTAVVVVVSIVVCSCIYHCNILSYYYSILFLFLVGGGVCEERSEDRVSA